MPEMPEVETIRRTLVDKVEGRKIIGVEIDLPRLIKWPLASKFQAVLTNQTIIKLKRRGKYLLFYLSNNFVLVVHLRMTGRLYYVTPGNERDRFTHIVFNLDNGDALLYADTRTLGTLYLMTEEELWRIAGLSSMGPEPLSEEFTLRYFSDRLEKRQATIKSVLLNQKIVGGLGNIYVDEALALACIDPERIASSLNDQEVKHLYQAVNQVIADGIAHGGTTFRDYRDGSGRNGNHQHYLNVYGRANQPCRRCGGLIARKQVAGRGTHYCPHCQK
ncbi:bifunctional DNA-formamidopyrimidine glycosylase/DNA-(apurinic or apyrimidinic site) lyase [Sporomusa acidovorans]|uniref:Formamidopyrimidine-DNA glycosylase n=1 Tax=Sporomusa acidovorans (strain ATCC 49682 / DSM 3132 / Mol) TaxID=1123286 RepID=A0ABZ3J3X6_SPOA4|nr:bifunctional DNA-formamidopyrimidine glycosylase/DNA-(apurinic or apyrimidinic site) lyase [Sporomusa acidovorans]OZC13384.1 formamidopyrimidine-DNA glycosylase [Sporomusa acidovorans DSM 3132]SDF78664.1 DNA-(apurinic or apyrimidinic site) lyase [Sporomusa acidovorans]